MALLWSVVPCGTFVLDASLRRELEGVALTNRAP
jgi:hypothetical protein